MKVIPAAFRAVFAVATVLGIHTGAALAQHPPQPLPDQTAIPQPAQAPEASPPLPPSPPAPQSGYPQQPGGSQQWGYPQQPGDAQQPGYPPQPGYPQQYPPGYAPPPGYVPPSGYGAPPPGYRRPPARYSYYPPPPPPPPPRLSTERPFMIGGSLGLGGMRYHDYPYNMPTSGPATGYSARLGFGLSPRLLLLIGADGAIVDSNNVYDQTIYYLGLQGFLTRQVFLRGGAGIGNITGKDPYGDFLQFGKVGFGLMGSIGVELLQGYNWSLELAGVGTAGFYKEKENWASGTVNIGFNFF